MESEIDGRPGNRPSSQTLSVVCPSVKLWMKAQGRVAKRDAEILRTMWKMIASGLSIFLGGFLLWHLDNEHCSKLKKWRHEIGMPWGFLLEGHGWW